MLLSWLDPWLYRQPFEGTSAARYASSERPAFGDLDERLCEHTRADLAAASREERKATPQRSREDDPRVRSREQVQRVDALVNEFRANVRGDVRLHVARGGELAASIVDQLATELDRVARDVTRALRG